MTTCSCNYGSESVGSILISSELLGCRIEQPEVIDDVFPVLGLNFSFVKKNSPIIRVLQLNADRLKIDLTQQQDLFADGQYYYLVANDLVVFIHKAIKDHQQSVTNTNENNEKTDLL